MDAATYHAGIERQNPSPTVIFVLVAASRPRAVALSGRDRDARSRLVCIRSCRPGTAILPGPPGGRREAYISTQHPPPCQEARFSRPDEHTRWSCRAQEPPRQGPRPSVGLIHRIRERAAFTRLARDGQRIRRSALWCTWCPDPDSTATCVAFAFSRAFGPAVRRNRVRRRLRAILRELDREHPLPPGLLMIGGRSQLDEHTFDQLRTELASLIDQIRQIGPASNG